MKKEDRTKTALLYLRIYRMILVQDKKWTLEADLPLALVNVNANPNKSQSKRPCLKLMISKHNWSSLWHSKEPQIMKCNKDKQMLIRLFTRPCSTKTKTNTETKHRIMITSIKWTPYRLLKPVPPRVLKTRMVNGTKRWNANSRSTKPTNMQQQKQQVTQEGTLPDTICWMARVGLKARPLRDLSKVEIRLPNLWLLTKAKNVSLGLVNLLQSLMP